MSYKQNVEKFEFEDNEINEMYEKYQDDIIKITNELKIEEFKEKFQKLKEKHNLIVRIKSIDNSSPNINKPEGVYSDRKMVIEYFDECFEVL